MDNNNTSFYMNRIIKLISPLTCQVFKIELNGEENELRELLGTILEINPKSIKGLRDSYNNYYTLSSAVKNPHINTEPFNYYTVVIKGIRSSNNINYMKYPTLNLIHKERKNSYFLPNYMDNNLTNNTMNYFRNEDDDYNPNNLKYLYSKSSKNNHRFYSSKINEFLNFAEELYKRNYIDRSIYKKLKQLILDDNKEVLSIIRPYLHLKSHRSYDELAKKIKPVISSRTKKSNTLEASKHNYSTDSENSKKEKKSKKTQKSSKKNKSKKNVKISNEEKILDDIKLNFTKEKYNKLKGLLAKKNKDIIRTIKTFEKDNDYNHLLSKLSRLTGSNSNSSDHNAEKTIETPSNGDKNENDSSYLIREGSDQKTKNKKDKSKGIKKVIKNITNALKSKGKDLYYISKYDLQKLSNDDKLSLFKKKFKLDLDKLSKDNYKIPKKNLTLIKNYYTQYITKKICKNFSEDEKLIYDHLMEEEDEENNILCPLYKDLLKHNDINKLKSKIKKTIKETEERIEEEENDDDDDENQGKNSIKEENEENEENEDEEDEEEEDDVEGEEDEEGEEDDNNKSEKESENQSNKKDSSSNKDNFLLKDENNKDRGVNLLNNNYRKINNFSSIANNNNENDDTNKNDEKKENKNNDNNLGLGFVVIKPKKTNREEGKNESAINYQNNNNNRLNTTNSVAKDSSLSTNNPNKKLNQFITQIEHLKKIDDIKPTIIEAIHANNKYVMELFQKFQKNKFNLNPKSLNEVYKQIKENLDTNSRDYQFQTLIKEIPGIDEFMQQFLCYEFSQKYSELETYYNLYEESQEKEEFIESIEIFMKKATTKKLLDTYKFQKIKDEISPILIKKNGGENNQEDLVNKSKEIIKVYQKYNLFNEKEYSIIMNSLENDYGIFNAAFQALFDKQDINDFYETMMLALEDHKKKIGQKGGDSADKWNNGLILKNFNEVKKNIDDKHLNTLEVLYKNKNENLYNILKDFNSSNYDKKVESIRTLILKCDLSPT